MLKFLLFSTFEYSKNKTIWQGKKEIYRLDNFCFIMLFFAISKLLHFKTRQGGRNGLAKK
jgi:hypothetical protein